MQYSWSRTSATCLRTSLANIYAIFNKRPFNRKTVFIVSVLRDISPGLRREVLLSEVGIEKSPSLRPVGGSLSLRQAGQSFGLSKNKNAKADKKCKVNQGLLHQGLLWE